MYSAPKESKLVLVAIVANPRDLRHVAAKGKAIAIAIDPARP